MKWLETNARSAWLELYQKHILAATGPDTAGIKAKITNVVVNSFTTYAERSFSDAWGVSGLALSGAKVLAGFLIPDTAMTAIKKITDAVGALLNIAFGIGKASAVDREIGKLEGTPQSRKQAILRQFADSRAETLFAEVLTLKGVLSHLQDKPKIESCEDLDLWLQRYAAARSLNNRLSIHVAYLESLTKGMRDLMMSSKDCLDGLEKSLDKIGVDAMSNPKWHVNRCLPKRICTFPWKEFEKVCAKKG